MSFEPKNVLITGGAGFIGANFVRHWLGTTHTGKVVVLDALTYAGNIDNLAGLERDPRYAFERGDICDEEAVRGDCDVVRFEDSAELAGLFEVEQDFSFTGRAEKYCVQFFEERGVGVVQRNPDAK